MDIKVGQKCHYDDPLVKHVSYGEVFSVNGDRFTVFQNIPVPPQANDTFVDFKVDDIGKHIWFD